MPNEDLYAELREAYDNLASGYGMADGEERVDEEVMRLFLKHVTAPAKILDMGSGPGQYSRCFAREGFDVVAMDNSPEMIKEAEERGLPPGMSAVCVDMRKMDFEEESFHAVFALASLIHLTPDALPNVLNRVRAILVRDGLFLANFAISDKGLRRERESQTEYAQAGRFFQHYDTQDEPRRMLEAAGFEIEEMYVRIVRPVLKDGSTGRTEWANFIGRAR